MIKVLGRATSGNVQMVVWSLAELGIPFERVDVGGMYRGNDTPEFLAMNPNGLVPVFVDQGVPLWESAAIVRYIGAQYGTNRFWPADPLERAVVDKWAEWIKTTFGPAFIAGVFWPIIGVLPDKRDARAVAAGLTKLEPLTRMLDAELSKGTAYLGGDDVCFADMIVGTLLYRYHTLEIDRPERPHLAAYYRRLCGRPAYAQHVMVSYETLRAK